MPEPETNWVGAQRGLSVGPGKLGETPLKTLLIAEAAVGAIPGLALILVPSVVASLIFGVPLDDSVGTVVGRGAGATLLTLAIVCWVWRSAGQSPIATGLIWAMLFYHIAVVAVLLSASFTQGIKSVGLWSVVAVHLGLGIWCLVCVRRASRLPLRV